MQQQQKAPSSASGAESGRRARPAGEKDEGERKREEGKATASREGKRLRESLWATSCRGARSSLRDAVREG